MLTRLEVDGFKNLLRLDVEFGPFTCIAGPNGAGKSNLFDAIQFLSLLADQPIMEAAQHVRTASGSGEATTGDPLELFWTDGTARAERIRFAAEMIVPSRVFDDFGREIKPSITYLRYELELGYEPPEGLAHLGRLVLLQEGLTHINLTEASRRLRFPHSAGTFRRGVLVGRRSGKAFISTKMNDGIPTIYIHQDGGSRGQPRPSPALSAPRTIVSTTTTSSDPTILAARREMQGWKMMALEPSAMRREDPFISPTQISPSGAHLAATLYRLATQTEGDDVADPASVYSQIANRASELVHVHGVRVDRDDQRRRLTLQLQERGGDYLPARALSDGTLRFLALCIMEADPTFTGVLCMEEPENGIHPARMRSMVELVRDLAVDTSEEPGPDNPMRQVIVNTHSPAFVQLQQRPDLLFGDEALVTYCGRPARALRLRPLRGTWRCTNDEPGISLHRVVAFLQSPPGAELSLPVLEAS